MVPMPTYNNPITEIIQQRFSCRRYLAEPIPTEIQNSLRSVLADTSQGPFSTPLRFDLIAAEDGDQKSLRSLGTYGFISHPMGFVAGVMHTGNFNLEGFGYRMEQIVLAITDLGLGSCWLGGTFTKSSFARRMGLKAGESIPAILSIGLIEDEAQARQGLVRRQVAGNRRIPWQQLFFNHDFDTPLSENEAGAYAKVLEMVRLGPSASNKQPWRIVKAGDQFHLYLQRTKGYRNVFTRLAQVDDMQRIDMGIAMCHFELTAQELGLSGKWVFEDPGLKLPDDLIEYIASWVAN